VSLSLQVISLSDEFQALGLCSEDDADPPFVRMAARLSCHRVSCTLDRAKFSQKSLYGRTWPGWTASDAWFDGAGNATSSAQHAYASYGSGYFAKPA
jgi:hypothetical protein